MAATASSRRVSIRETVCPSGRPGGGNGMNYALETQGLSKVYGGKPALRDVSLHVAEGQIYAA